MISALRMALSLVGAVAGYMSSGVLLSLSGWAFTELQGAVARCACAALFAVLFFLAAGYISKGLADFCDRAARVVSGLTFSEAVVACGGLVAGLAVAFFFALPIAKDNWIGLLSTILLNFLLGYSGLYLALWKRRDGASEHDNPAIPSTGSGASIVGVNSGGALTSSVSVGARGGVFAGGGSSVAGGEVSGSAANGAEGASGALYGCSKLLDTSSVIDGRVFDVLRTGFLDGELVVPEFVLDELRHIADSQDPIKRSRGRRGLDVLKLMQEEFGARLRVDKSQLPKGAEVDAELVRLAQRDGHAILTTDYNLNKVAAVKGVKALNVNDLSNAVRQPVAPGEDICVRVVKDGKEAGQGVAYLTDGTMVVIEGARQFVGYEISVTLTSILQTSAGRMAFAALKPDAGQQWSA